MIGEPWSGQHVSMWLLPSNPLQLPNTPQGQTAGCFPPPSYNWCLPQLCPGALSKAHKRHGNHHPGKIR